MLRRIPRLVGGIDADSARLAASFLRRLCDDVFPVSSPEVSELSKLLENAFISVGVALVGEATGIARALGISGREVTEAAATKPFGYHAFHPGPGVGGHCLPNDLDTMASCARELGCDAALLDAASAVVARMPVAVVDELEAILRQSGRALHGARVLVVGAGFKIGTEDTTASPAREVIRQLRRRGAASFYTDSLVDSFCVDDQAVARVDAKALDHERFTAALVLSGDRALRAESLMRAADVVLDAGGGQAIPGGLPGAHRL
jgi:nucleotide sugar dehydrogenase